MILMRPPHRTPGTGHRTAADLLTRHLFPVSHRSLEAWPLLTQRVNGAVDAHPFVTIRPGVAAAQ
jgi:hypothetical protein